MEARGGVAVLASLATLVVGASCSGSDLECGTYRGPRNELVVLDRSNGDVLRTRRAPEARFLSRDGALLAAARSVEREGGDDLQVVATLSVRGTTFGVDDGPVGHRVVVGTTTVEQFARSGDDERRGIRAVDGDGRLRWELPLTGVARIAAADTDAVAVVEEASDDQARVLLVSLADGRVRWTTGLSGTVIESSVLTDHELGTLVGARTFGCG